MFLGRLTFVKPVLRCNVASENACTLSTLWAVERAEVFISLIEQKRGDRARWRREESCESSHSQVSSDERPQIQQFETAPNIMLGRAVQLSNFALSFNFKGGKKLKRKNLKIFLNEALHLRTRKCQTLDQFYSNHFVAREVVKTVLNKVKKDISEIYNGLVNRQLAYIERHTHTDLRDSWMEGKKRTLIHLLVLEQDLFECAPYLSFRDISNYFPITLPLYTATLWHFHKTFASVREHDSPQLKAC